MTPVDWNEVKTSIAKIGDVDVDELKE